MMCFYTPANKVWGVYRNQLVHLSVSPSVRLKFTKKKKNLKNVGGGGIKSSIVDSSSCVWCYKFNVWSKVCDILDINVYIYFVI